MGMEAELYAIGPYSKDVAPFLDYPASFYEDTPEGAVIITTVASCVSSVGSNGLAEALGIQPWAFEQHCDVLSHTRLEDVDLSLFAASAEGGTTPVESFLKLALAGFKFYYRPNG